MKNRTILEKKRLKVRTQSFV